MSFAPELLPPEPFMTVFWFAFGMIIGSFLNVCIYRLPLGLSVVHPGSRCPSCKQAIRWYQNVPVFSWLLLRGRCANCRVRISVRYPMIEAFTGLVLAALWYGYGATPEFAIAAPFTLAMLVLFFTDLDHRLLPDAVTLLGLGVGLALAWFNPFLGDPGWARIGTSLGGAALGSGLLWSIGAVYGKLRGVEAMGMGDVKMMGLVGAFAGPWGVLFTIFAASFAGAVFGIVLIPLRGRSLQDALPFGCFLAPAALAALLVGRRAFEAYFSILLPPQ